MTKDDYIQQSHKIIERAVQEHKPSLLVLSFSGGYDSMVSSHLARQWALTSGHSINTLTMSVDTTISADGWPEFVASAARQMKLGPFQLWQTTHFQEWADRAIEKGIPYRESQHKINFYYLKQVAFRACVQKHKKFHTDRIMFINGVRRAESAARQNASEVERQGSGVYVNAIVHWPDEMVQQYRIDHNMPQNPFYDNAGNSGDCLCNWHIHFKAEDVRRHSPKAWQRLKPVHEGCQARWGYGYGEEPRNGTFVEGAGVQMLLPGLDETPMLCAGCQKPAPKNEAVADVMLSRMQW